MENIEIVFGGLWGVESKRGFIVRYQGKDPNPFRRTYQVVEQWVFEAEEGGVLRNRNWEGRGKGRAWLL